MDILKRDFNIQIRQDSDSALSGYAFKFSETADGWYGKERFDPALVVQFNDPTFLLYAHDPNSLIGKRGENLEIKTDDKGLFFRVDPLPETTLCRDIKELVKKNILNGASVGFSVLTSRKDDGVNVFEKIILYEVSFTGNPYYKSSEVKPRKNKEKEKVLYPPECY